ncbi:MAG: cell division protein FtsA [Chthoniobacterales bacterium]|nr:cell division protein FtsA [Chthoniobacterales bacterium]
MKEEIRVGLEIGTTKTCVVVTECRGLGHPLKILGYGSVPSSGVRKGEIVNIEQATERLKEALLIAQGNSDCDIDSVWVSVTGGHLKGVVNRGVVELPEDKTEIDEDDLSFVESNAKEITISDKERFVHTIFMKYYLDGNDCIENPLGMYGRRLAADYHLIYGIGTRIQNTLRCVRDTGLEVEEVVASSLASAYAVLSEQDKQMGVLLMDIGGGVTDYIAFVDGAIYSSGVLSVGGDHVTNDISIGLKVATSRAEHIKCKESSCWLEETNDTLILKSEGGHLGKEIQRYSLNQIVSARMSEILMLIKKRVEKDVNLELLRGGVVLTGGGSCIQGLKKLAERIFSMNVRVLHAKKEGGLCSVYTNPAFATAIGVAKFAHWHSDRMTRKSWLSKLLNFWR